MVKPLRSQNGGAGVLDGINELDELAAIPTVSPQQTSNRRDSIGRAHSRLVEEDLEAGFSGIDELDAPPPDENPDDGSIFYHQSLEEEREIERRRTEEERSTASTKRPPIRERLLLELYSISWLIFFSLLGTLARLGVEWLANYPNAPVTTTVLWANFGGSLVMGFLQEDRALFAEERGSAGSSGTDDEKEKQQTHAQHLAVKKTLPLYIGLTVGFCGSFTSFSSFMRDLFLGLANDLVGKGHEPAVRSAGWSVCSILGIMITEVAVSLSALAAGAHIAISLFPMLYKIPKMNSAPYTNPLGVFLGFACWLGAVFLAIWPPHNDWRGEVTFALVFAPLGTLLRFFLSIRLNRYIASFPLGTFSANILGTAILGMAYDLQHTSLPSGTRMIGGGIVACQILAGIIEGFCGCLTTVSTWVAELRSLRKQHAYVYGFVSVATGLIVMVVIIGSLQWSIGLHNPVCKM